MDGAGSELDFFKQKVSQLTAALSRTLGSINDLIEANAASLSGTMAHLNGITGSVDGLLAAERDNLRTAMQNLTRFTQTLDGNAERIDSIVGSVDAFAAQLADREFTENLTGTVRRLNDILAKVDEGGGTVGCLFNDPALYRSLDEASGNLAQLLADLKANPTRYVHFSVFGRSEAKEKAREQKRAAKAEAKAVRDSIRRAR